MVMGRHRQERFGGFIMMVCLRRTCNSGADGHAEPARGSTFAGNITGFGRLVEACTAADPTEQSTSGICRVRRRDTVLVLEWRATSPIDQREWRLYFGCLCALTDRISDFAF